MVHTNLKTGWEAEFNVTYPDGTAIDLRSMFNRPLFEDGFAKLVLDAGRDQVEACTNPNTDTCVHMQEMESLLAASQELQGSLYLHFDPRRQVGTPACVEDFYKPRLQRMLQALQDEREGGVHGVEVVEAGNINAFHCHFDVSGFSDDEKNLVMCLLNLAAPAMLEWVHSTFQLPQSNRNQVWTRFARSERLPAPRWFPDFASFQEYFESIEQLLKVIGTGDKHGGEYCVDLAQKQCWPDPAAEGVMWWSTRIRAQYGTVEFRPLPTVGDTRQMQQIVLAIDDWIDESLRRVGGRSFETFDEAASANFIPAFQGIPMPKNSRQWWKRWSQF